MNVIVTVSRGKESTSMKTFTIDDQNNITAFATKEEAAATTATPFDSFASQKELAELAETWAPERLVAIWNSLPGVKQVKGFKDSKAAVGRIWERIQRLGEPEKPKVERKAKGSALAPKGASVKAKSSKKGNPCQEGTQNRKRR
jgi:hypothetical protein